MSKMPPMTDTIIRSTRMRFTPAEAQTLAGADRDALTAMTHAAMRGPVAALPEAIPRADPAAAYLVLPRLVLPGDLAEQWAAASQERRAQWVRAGIARLAAHHSEGRYLLSDAPYPGVAGASRQAMTTGNGTRVMRAAWLTRAGLTRAGTRPGQVIGAGELGLATPLPLWRVEGDGGDLLRVIAAENLFEAASGESVRAYRPEILGAYQELLRGEVDSTDYLI